MYKTSAGDNEYHVARTRHCCTTTAHGAAEPTRHINRSGCGAGGRVGCPLITGLIPGFSQQRVDVSLGKTWKPQVAPDGQANTFMVARCHWRVNGQRRGKALRIKALTLTTLSCIQNHLSYYPATYAVWSCIRNCFLRFPVVRVTNTTMTFLAPKWYSTDVHH